MSDLITSQMLSDWRTNYGLDKRTPIKAMHWWQDNMDGMAPAGVVAALGLCINEIERLTAELETERMRLAACGVVALANTEQSAAKAREMLPEYRSASLTDVERAVDREMKLRTERDEARAERDALRIELDVCRSAIEDCYDIVETFDCYNDSDDACQRVTLRRLNEAIGKAAPRLLYERSEGQKLYGLRYRELMAERDALHAVATDAHRDIDELRRQLAEAGESIARQAATIRCLTRPAEE